jgi:GT2 family glycosyltransferase
MALLAIAIYDPEEANRSEITKDCLHSLLKTVSVKHRIFLIDNASCDRTKAIIQDCTYHPNLTIITNEKNLGTAEAINLAWKHREPGEACMKIDNDVLWHQDGWVDLMEEALRRDSKLGIVGAKRKDCWENPAHPDPQYRSTYFEIPHIPGEKWIVAEQCKHIIGTCQMYNPALLDKIGYLYQPSLYGYDDVLASYRSEIAGFKNVFLPQIEIDHIDPGGTPYQSWKEKHSGEQTQKVIALVDEYIKGTKSIYYNPFE